VHVVVGGGGAEALQLDVVLVAPPVGGLGRRQLLVEDGRGDPVRLPAGVRPVLAFQKELTADSTLQLSVGYILSQIGALDEAA
jgi:hypothetical protein